AIERPRQVDELPQVRQLALAEELEHQRRVVAAVGQDTVEQPGDGKPILDGTPRRQVATGAVDALELTGRNGRLCVDVEQPGPQPSAVPADDEQRLVAEAAER